MLTEVFIVKLPDNVNNLCRGGQTTQHSAGIIEDSFDFTVQLLRRLVELDRQHNWRFQRPILSQALHLFVEAGINFVVLVPTDQAPRAATIGIV
jgi:hypothetical protein